MTSPDDRPAQPMKEKRPQPTETLIERLRRVAKWLDTRVDPDDADHGADTQAAMRARANTCWQAAARLEALIAGLPPQPERQEQKNKDDQSRVDGERLSERTGSTASADWGGYPLTWGDEG